MTYLVLARSAYEDLVRKLQRIQSPLWGNDELAAIHTCYCAYYSWPNIL